MSRVQDIKNTVGDLIYLGQNIRQDDDNHDHHPAGGTNGSKGHMLPKFTGYTSNHLSPHTLSKTSTLTGPAETGKLKPVTIYPESCLL
jgi:hypothetical protein